MTSCVLQNFQELYTPACVCFISLCILQLKEYEFL